MYFDPMYFLFALPALLLGMWAQFRVSSAFGKYSEVGTRSGMTGAQAARRILDYNGLQNVAVERVDGFLSDHYDPSQKILRLSSAVYDQPSLAAVGVAAHETGHALQDKEHYVPFDLSLCYRASSANWQLPRSNHIHGRIIYDPICRNYCSLDWFNSLCSLCYLCLGNSTGRI